MTIQGGGGGKKIPPGGPQAPPKAPRGESTAPTGKAPPVKDAPPAGEAKAAKDAFVQKPAGMAPFKSTADVRLDDAFLHAVTPSGIENLVRMLESARAQLLGEHAKARIEGQKLVERLVLAGFSEAQLSATRQELYELRKKMAAVRKRLQHLQRRLKSAFAQAGKTADANLQKTLGQQLERLKKLEPGLQRSLGALSVIEQAYSGFSDGSPAVLRARVDEGAAPELVAALSMLAPGAVAARVLHGLVRDGPDASPSIPALPAAAAREPTAAAGLRAFAAAFDPKQPGDEER